MNLPSNLAKSCLLASVIFWIIIGSESVDTTAFLFVFLSMIPIVLVVSFTIIITICPFFWVSRSGAFNHQTVFKTYFPYYAIVAFGICTFGIIVSDFDIYMIAFFTSAFITTSQCWIWFAKEK